MALQTARKFYLAVIALFKIYRKMKMRLTEQFDNYSQKVGLTKRFEEDGVKDSRFAQDMAVYLTRRREDAKEG
ncbi:MAG: hypothetical protein VR65_21355 [Desulfobulbaceae bacterium BRH_c16a]|nr:MAG: hypothetical protein VR65_21355 [Desulfobulbaceae bacterium BRH_c16a]